VVEDVLIQIQSIQTGLPDSFPLFSVNPVPSTPTTQNNTDKEQYQLPGIRTGKTPVDPNSEGNAQQGWDQHRPAYYAKQAQPNPDATITPPAPPRNAPG